MSRSSADLQRAMKRNIIGALVWTRNPAVTLYRLSHLILLALETGLLLLDAYLIDIVGLVLHHRNKVTIAIK